MRFTLYYRGDLKSNRGAADKHVLRRHFHGQLAELWNHHPLSDNREELLKGESLSIAVPVGQFQFAPLVSSRIFMTAALEVTMLRPGPPGSVVAHGGDIDNRLKTLLDALKVPSEPNALPAEAIPSEDESPFFTLFEDDQLITALSVHTDRLLDPNAGQSEVVLLLRVTTRVSRALWGNIGLSG
jgi:hypothetical protein